MNIPLFHRNKVVKFWTNHKGKGKYRDFRGDRYYLLFSVDKIRKLLFLFPITSNRNNLDDYPSQHKVSEPRPPCLKSKIYLKSFVNASILIEVPFEAISYLNFCQKCSSPFCLEKDFEEITQLHSGLINYGIKIDEVKLTMENFKKE